MTSELESSSPLPSSTTTTTATAPNACDVAGTNIGRAFMCQIAQAIPNEKETKVVSES